jgi:adenylosuccinate synthase
MIGEVIGIAKAYTTRVGAGPFPTEVTDDTARMIQERGAERGATTGRARRCGWLDIVALRYSIAVNGIKRIIVTKLDVLDSFETIKVCVAYDIDGRQTDCFPRTADELGRVNPVYVEMPGWMSVTKEARHESELPPRALAYLNEICRLADVDLCSVSVGAKGEAIVEFTSVF